MKVVIFAGGLGTRISEETDSKPKPMIEIGGKPILWHIMKIYSNYGFNEFIICLGYKGHIIKDYFLNYYKYNSNLEIDLNNNTITELDTTSENFKITLVDTGLNTKTAGRLKQIESFIDDDTFMLTYGDGLCDVNILELLEYHNRHNKTVTVTGIQPDAKFGSIEIDTNGNVIAFKEKPKGDGKWINGGFFICNKSVFNYLPDNSNDIMWEDEPLEKIVESNQLVAYKHYGFWKCMDALRDKIDLDTMWNNNNAKWKTWK